MCLAGILIFGLVFVQLCKTDTEKSTEVMYGARLMLMFVHSLMVLKSLSTPSTFVLLFASSFSSLTLCALVEYASRTYWPVAFWMTCLRYVTFCFFNGCFISLLMLLVR